MRNLFINMLILFSLSISAQENEYLNISKPEYIEIHNNSDSIIKVESNNKKTIVYFKATGDSESEVIIYKNACIIDENGNKYIVKKANGIKLGKKTKIGKKGQLLYSLTFPALPKGTKSIDLYLSERLLTTNYLNIHQVGTESSFSTSIDTTGFNEAVNNTFSNNLFKKDTVWIEGQFKDSQIFEENKYIISFVTPIPSIYGGSHVENYEIRPDGSFNFKIPIYAPTWTELMVYAPSTSVIGRLIPIMLYPGDHISLTIDDFESNKSEHQIKSELVKNIKFSDLYYIFPTRRIIPDKKNKVDFDSLKNTITLSEKAACYLSNKYNLTKTESALLLTQANMSKVHEALMTIDNNVRNNRSKYFKVLDGRYPDVAQFDTLQSFSKTSLYKVFSLLRADNKAFLIVPAVEALSRYLSSSAMFEGITFNEDYLNMPQDYRHLFWKNQALHMLRMNRNKTVGSDKLFEQWFSLANMEATKNKDKISHNLKDIMEIQLENVTLDVYQAWKKEMTSNLQTSNTKK